MLTTYGLLAILVILVFFVLALGLLAWFLLSSSKKKPPESKTDVKTNVKTQPVVQRFVSNDLKKRAFIVRQNEGGFKVIYERYSTEVINLGGEVAGWQALSEKPVVESLAGAVELAHNWVHSED
jgi:hypothetical protein